MEHLAVWAPCHMDDEEASIDAFNVCTTDVCWLCLWFVYSQILVCACLNRVGTPIQTSRWEGGGSTADESNRTVVSLAAQAEFFNLKQQGEEGKWRQLTWSYALNLHVKEKLALWKHSFSFSYMVTLLLRPSESTIISSDLNSRQHRPPTCWNNLVFLLDG